MESPACVGKAYHEKVARRASIARKIERRPTKSRRVGQKERRKLCLKLRRGRGPRAGRRVRVRAPVRVFAGRGGGAHLFLKTGRSRCLAICEAPARARVEGGVSLPRLSHYAPSSACRPNSSNRSR